MNELCLNKLIFDLNSIKRAAADFDELCEIKIEESENYFVCKFKNCRYDATETMKEFENYTVDLMNAYDN